MPNQQMNGQLVAVMFSTGAFLGITELLVTGCCSLGFLVSADAAVYSMESSFAEPRGERSGLFSGFADRLGMLTVAVMMCNLIWFFLPL